MHVSPCKCNFKDQDQAMAERKREDTVNFAPGPAQLPLEVQRMAAFFDIRSSCTRLLLLY